MDLHAAHLLDALTGSGQGKRQEVVDEPRVDTGDEDARVPLLGSALHPGNVFVGDNAPGVLRQAGRRAHDIAAGRQDAHHVRHCVGQPGVSHRAVDDALGRGGQHRIQIVDRRDPGLDTHPGEVAGVTAHLLGRGYTHRGQLERRVGHQLAQGQPPDVSGSDVSNPDRHGVSSIPPQRCNFSRQ